MPLIRKFSLFLTTSDSFNNNKKVYYIDDSRSLHIFYNEMENAYIISFKNDRKEIIVTARHFHITGNTYAKL